MKTLQGIQKISHPFITSRPGQHSPVALPLNTALFVLYFNWKNI